MNGEIRADEARVNITWRGQNADLPDPVNFDTNDGDVRGMVNEALRGGIPGIDADPAADLRDFVVDRFTPTAQRPYNLIQVRPKTPFGNGRFPGEVDIGLVRTLIANKKYGPWMIGMINHCIDEILTLRRQITA